MIREIMAQPHAFAGSVLEEIHPGVGLQGERGVSSTSDAQPGELGLPRCRHLPDGRRRTCPSWTRA